MQHQSIRGRGAADNPANRFEQIHLEPDPDADPADSDLPTTRFYKDSSRTIVSYNDSPDIGFEASVNPYRGCEHGCIYCYARPTHEYLGFSAGLDFETRIMVKPDAPELLSRELAGSKWKPQVIAMSGVTDPYQPVERKLKLTRRCLEVLLDFRNPVGIVTKNHLVTRDIDLLAELASHGAAVVYLSLTTLDPDLTPKLEPRSSLPKRRLSAVRELSEAGIPVGVLVAPVIPAINDHEIPRILEAAAEAGARSAGYVTLRLPYGVAPMFEDWLSRHYPDRKDKVLNQVRAVRGGKLNDPKYGTRMRGEGRSADQLKDLFSVACRKAGLDRKAPRLSALSFRVPPSVSPQMQKTFPFL